MSQVLGRSAARLLIHHQALPLLRPVSMTSLGRGARHGSSGGLLCHSAASPTASSGSGGSDFGSGGGGSRPHSSGGSGGGGGQGPSDSGSHTGLWERYLQMLEHSPLLTKAVTTAIISLLGNLFCQLVVEGSSSVDWQRLATFTLLGFFFVAPALHWWFGTLSRLVPAAGNKGAMARMAVDQLCFAPLFIASIMAILTVVEGKPGAIQERLQQGWPSAVRANWVLWVPAQFLNFRFVPLNRQLLAANITALIWNIYLSAATRPAKA